jgi:F0F1-type ATP synthase assembly protein I
VQTTNYKRESYNGFGDGLSKAFELAVMPILFGGIGYLIDGKTHTRPLFTALLAILCVIGLFVRMWASYKTSMDRHDADGAWSASADGVTQDKSPANLLDQNGKPPMGNEVTK